MSKPTITPYQFNLYTSQISDIYVALEDTLFMQMAQRLKTSNEQGKDYVLQWQIERMQQLNMLNQETIQTLAEITGIAAEMIEVMMAEVGYDTIESVDEQLAKAKGKKLPPPNDMSERLTAYVTQTFLDLDNYVNQTLITTNLGEGTVARTYRKIIEETTAQVLAGNMTINQAVAQTVVKWRERGIDTGFVDKGGNVWRLEHYTDTAIRSTVNRTYNELRLSCMEQYDVELVRVNSYSNARPSCAKIQGRVASLKTPGQNKSNYPRLYEFGYGKPDGIRGINCRHMLYPFIEGVNENNEQQVDETKANEEYKLTQQQRYLERQMREAKRSLKLAEEIGDAATIEKYKHQVRNRQAKVREFIAEHGLTRRYDKERIR